MIKNFDNFKFHCSQLGKIYSAKGELTVANKTFLRELFTETIEGKRKEITSRYFEKGHFMEEDGVSMVNETLYPKELLIKNKERKENEFITGVCDLPYKNIVVYDVKNAWDVFTFGKASLTDDYEQQGRGYMWLWKVKKFRLYYCLNNMPEHMLVDEERKMFYRHSFVTMEDPEYLKLCEELRAFHNYDNRPIWDRFKIWELDHSDAEIEKLKIKIGKSRAYLNDLLEEQRARIAYNRGLMGIFDDVLIAEHKPELSATIIEKG